MPGQLPGSVRLRRFADAGAARRLPCRCGRLSKGLLLSFAAGLRCMLVRVYQDLHGLSRPPLDAILLRHSRFTWNVPSRRLCHTDPRTDTREEIRLMNLPRFTADASIRRTSRGYWRVPRSSRAGSRLVPALCFPDGHCGPCVNGIQHCCEGGHIVSEECSSPPPPPTCGPCIGVRHCSDGTNRPCTV
jgi:hypothetical protein